jgi:hypothetical protein
MGKIATATLSILWVSGAMAQTALTTREREALSSRAANRAVQSDLLSVFEPTKKIDSGMFRQLHGVGLTTQAFGTEFAGVCRRDAVTLWYAPIADGSKPEDAPVRPYSVEAQPLFNIIKLPREEPRNVQDRGFVWRTDCASAGRSEGKNWFTARNSRIAVQGALVLEAALNAIRTGTLKAEPCPKSIDTDKSTCEAAILANSDPSKIDSIEVCPSEAGTVCYVVDMNARAELTIKARTTESVLIPSSVTSIAIELYIIVT